MPISFQEFQSTIAAAVFIVVVIMLSWALLSFYWRSRLGYLLGYIDEATLSERLVVGAQYFSSGKITYYWLWESESIGWCSFGQKIHK